MATVKMDPKDVVYGSLAECYVTIDGNRYNFMQLHEFESKMEINLVEVPILGRVTKGTKATQTKGTWTGTAYYNSSILRKWLLSYKRTGVLIPFDIQISNEDPSTQVGRQTVIHRGCLVDSLILAKFVAGEDILNEDISGTFDDWDMPETFRELPGMR